MGGEIAPVTGSLRLPICASFDSIFNIETLPSRPTRTNDRQNVQSARTDVKETFQCVPVSINPQHFQTSLKGIESFVKVWTLPVLACGLVAISLSAIFIEWSNAPASDIGMYRLLMATALILPLAWRERSQLAHISRKDTAWLGISGICLGL